MEKQEQCGCGHEHCGETEIGVRYGYAAPGAWPSEDDTHQNYYAVIDLDDEHGRSVVALASTEGMAMIITQVLNDDPEAVDAFLSAVEDHHG